MQLTVSERLHLLMILPGKANFLNSQIIKDLGNDIGNATLYWNEVNAKLFTDRGCIPHLDGSEAISLIRKTGPSAKLANSSRMKPHALKRIQYDALPAWVYDDGKCQLPDGSVVQGEEGLDLSGMIGLLLAAVKNLDGRLAALSV